MTEAMPFLQKAILLSYAPRSLSGGLFFYHEYSRRKYSGFVKDNEANLNQNQQKFRSAGGLFLYIQSA